MSGTSFKVIKQREEADCAVCVLSMFLNKDYNELLEDFPMLKPMIKNLEGGGVSKEVILAIIYLVKGTEGTLFYFSQEQYIKRKPEIFNLIKGKPAILSAKSLNHKFKSHAVYWDGYKIYDPSNNKVYTKESIYPYCVIM